MTPGSFKLNTREFNETLSRYLKISRRTEEEIVNTKAYFIARRAVVETIKADKGKIRAFFDAKTQKIVGMIINKARGKRGEKGLYGDEMAEAQAAMKAARLRAVGFMKSGFIWAIKKLEPYVKSRRGAARSEAGSAKIYGRPKGDAVPAKQSRFVVVAIVRHFAESKRSTTPEPGEKFVKPALQRAIDFESASMQKYIEDKMRTAANESGIKTS